MVGLYACSEQDIQKIENILVSIAHRMSKVLIILCREHEVIEEG